MQSSDGGDEWLYSFLKNKLLFLMTSGHVQRCIRAGNRGIQQLESEPF